MLASRFRGGLVAAVVGDCIGALFECSGEVKMEEVLVAVQNLEKKWNDNKKRDAEGKKRKPNALLPFTDDTAMARSIAKSLIEHKAVNIPDIALRFGKEFDQEPYRGYGGSVVTVLRALADPDLKDLFQPAKEQFNGSGSYGNGGGMRICPLGFFCHQLPLEELKEKTIEITELTHSHPHAIVGAVLESFAVQLALALDNRQLLDANRFLDTLLERLKPVERAVYAKMQKKKTAPKESDQSEGESKLPYCDKLEVIREFLTREVDSNEVDEKLGTDIAALESVPAAVYCFLKGAGKSVRDCQERSEVEQTILYAISLGGDTDTIATMAAAISGAFFGLDHVPQSWLDSCEGVDDALMFGEKLVDIVSAREASS